MPRFLNTETGEFVQLDLSSRRIRKSGYAILSHTWNNEGEQSYMELREIQKRYDLKALCPRHSCPSYSPQPLSSVISTPTNAPASSSAFHCSSCPSVEIKETTSLSDYPTNSLDQTYQAKQSLTICSIYQILQFILLVLFLPAYLQPISLQYCAPRPVRHAPKCCIWHDPELSPKVREACRAAREAGYELLWIDSSCINKESSTELSESINSMYLWYSRAKVCYAYLADVPSGENPRAEGSAFRKSRWFLRGWTLQELIAPYTVTFLSKDWDTLGDKDMLADVVEEITGVPLEALLHTQSLDDFSVAQRLAWASKRRTTRVEDLAYSLLGIFDINMSPLYGEGERAFRRLQEEILRRVPDQSLFAWEDVFMDLDISQDLAQCSALQKPVTLGLGSNKFWDNQIASSQPLLARAPQWLYASGGIRSVRHDDVSRRLQLPQLPAPHYTHTPHGIQTHLPVIRLKHCLPHSTIRYPDNVPEAQWYLAILGCEHIRHPGALLGRICYTTPSHSGVEQIFCKHIDIDPKKQHGISYPSALFPLSPATLARCRQYITLKTVYISYPERTVTNIRNLQWKRHSAITLVLRKKTRDAVRAQGYKAELRPDPDDSALRLLTISNSEHTLAIEYRHTVERNGWTFNIKARVKMLRSLLEPAEDIEATPSCVEWNDDRQLCQGSLGTREVDVNLGTNKLTVRLALDFAGLSYYVIHVNLNLVSKTITTSPGAAHPEGVQECAVS